MKVTIYRESFDFYEIRNEHKQNFVHKTNRELGDAEQWALKTIGDAIRDYCSQHFWSDGCYCWYTDETQEREDCVFMSTTGVVCYENRKSGKLYRVLF